MPLARYPPTGRKVQLEGPARKPESQPTPTPPSPANGGGAAGSAGGAGRRSVARSTPRTSSRSSRHSSDGGSAHGAALRPHYATHLALAGARLRATDATARSPRRSQ